MTYRCRTCGRDNRLPNQCGCEPRYDVRTDYLHDRGTDKLVAAIQRHDEANDRVSDALDYMDRMEREHQETLRQSLGAISAARMALLEMCYFGPTLE